MNKFDDLPRAYVKNVNTTRCRTADIWAMRRHSQRNDLVVEFCKRHRRVSILTGLARCASRAEWRAGTRAPQTRYDAQIIHIITDLQARGSAG